MKAIFDHSQYTIFQYTGDKDLFVAVPREHSEQIDRFVKEYGSMEKIPPVKTVRGIFLKGKKVDDLQLLSETEQENDITVNQLKRV
jgi:hypothetical protein